MKTLLSALLVALALVLPGASFAQAKPGKVTVAWSVWTGWMPFKVMEKEGLLAKRAKELGAEVELVEFKGYMDSVTAFSAGKVDACAMTNMEALQPASNGIKTVAVVANDSSNGGDGLVLRNGMKIADLKGKKVYLEQFSVSHYLLTRALDAEGIAPAEVSIVNMPGDEAGKAFLTDDSIQAVATWNPHLFNAQENGKGFVAFDSSKIPGEIVDLLVFNEKIVAANPKAVEAVVLAWYDAVAMLEKPETRARAVQIMAEGAGTTPKEFERLLGGTILYTKPTDTVSLFGGPKLKSTMVKVKKFSVDNELVRDGTFEIGYGAGAKGALRFDPTFAEKAGK